MIFDLQNNYSNRFNQKITISVVVVAVAAVVAAAVVVVVGVVVVGVEDNHHKNLLIRCV